MKKITFTPTDYVYLAVALLLGLYAIFFRTIGLDVDFFLAKDQIDDWSYVQVPFSKLPILGPRKTGGGYHWGPAYYWVLWIVRNTIGRLYDNLPHGCGVAFCIIRGAAMTFFSYTMMKLRLPVIITIGLALAMATSPFEASLSRTIWNPGVMVSFSIVAIALTLKQIERPSKLTTFLAVVLMWMAVQMHLSAFFLAVLLLLAMLFIHWRERRWVFMRDSVLIFAGVVFALQIPYTYSLLTGKIVEKDAHTQVDSTLDLLLSSSGIPSINRGLSFVLKSLHQQFFLPPDWPLLQAVFGAFVVVMVGAFIFKKQDRRVAVTVALLGISTFFVYVVGCSVLERLQSYWVFPMIAPLLMMFFFALAATGQRYVSSLIGLVVLASLVLEQPERYARTRDLRHPQYHTAVDAVREIFKTKPVLGRVSMEGEPAAHFSESLYEYIGGTIDRSNSDAVVIHRDGSFSLIPKE